MLLYVFNGFYAPCRRAYSDWTVRLSVCPSFRHTLGLGLGKCSLFICPLRCNLHIWSACAYGQGLSIRTQILTPVTLTLNLGSDFRFRNLGLGFEKSS